MNSPYQQQSLNYSSDGNSMVTPSENSWHDLEPIPPESSCNEDDYDYDSDFYSGDEGTISIPDSVRDYVYENGRTYHSYNSGKYALPNDSQECMRLDLFHHLFRMRLDGELYTAPLKNPKKVLDIGTGTGVWAIDMAEQFPEAEIFGNDLSPIQATFTWANVKFEIDDVELDWTHQDNYFDFIHIRSMMGAIKDWDRLFEQAYRCCAPGGYIEFQDQGAVLHSDDNTLPADSAFGQWMSLLRSSSQITERPFDIAPHIRPKLTAAGFVGVHQRVYKWPIGAWPKDRKLKEIGRASAVVAADSLEAFALGVLTRCFGWTKEEVDVLVEKAREELRVGMPEGKGKGKGKRGMHVYDNGYFIYARKPAVGEKVKKSQSKMSKLRSYASSGLGSMKNVENSK